MEIVAVKLPNGKLQIISGEGKGEIFENEESFYSKYRVINESTGTMNSCSVLESINE